LLISQVPCREHDGDNLAPNREQLPEAGRRVRVKLTHSERRSCQIDIGYWNFTGEWDYHVSGD